MLIIRFIAKLSLTDIFNKESTMTHEEKISYLSAFMKRDVFEFIICHLNGMAKNERLTLTKTLFECIRLLSESFTTKNDPKSLTRNLIYIRAFYCKRHTQSTTTRKYALLKNAVRSLAQHGLLSVYGELPQEPQNAEDYKNFKQMVIPKETLDKFTITQSADSIFNKTLEMCCTPEIGNRLKEHVRSYKYQKHHRRPLVRFLIQLSNVEPNWHKHTNVIQGELLKFRHELLNNYQRNTAYGKFQNVKNAFSVLIEHQLLSNKIELPSNLRRCTNTQRIRLNNTIISELNIYDDKNLSIIISQYDILRNLKEDISNNIKLLITISQKIIYESYHKFLSKDDIVANSQIEEIIKHPQLLIKNTSTVKTARKEKNPFNHTHHKCFENRLAALDYYFDLVCKNEQLPDVDSLCSSNNLLEHLGLTPFVASAMQIIIVNELGINPYSLYKAKITSDGHGHEFIQITDSGSVRLNALKRRAKKVRQNHAEGSKKNLLSITPHDIDAATCLKIALEMTSRTRKLVNRQELWLCLTNYGAKVPAPETFQNKFSIISNQASSTRPALKYATLKKLRSSKAVLIYLETNGDSVKAATYLGNKIKTALSYYIPQHIKELVYRNKIRAYQNILLFMAVAPDELPQMSLNISKSQFDAQVRRAFFNPNFGGRLYKKLFNNDVTNEDSETIYFCVSEINIALAINYARDGLNDKIRNDCKSVIAKISEGPIILKQLLRKAQVLSDTLQYNR